MNDVHICELCLKAYRPEEIKGARILKEFDGYTVDFRLQQFRKIKLNELPKFIDFTSEKGKELLLKMHKAILN